MTKKPQKPKRSRWKRADAPTEPQQDPKADHGAADCYMDNIGEGWRIECLCGWVSTPNRTMQSSGEEFDEHLKSLYPNYPDRKSEAA